MNMEITLRIAVPKDKEVLSSWLLQIYLKEKDKLCWLKSSCKTLIYPLLKKSWRDILNLGLA